MRSPMGYWDMENQLLDVLENYARSVAEIMDEECWREIRAELRQSRHFEHLVQFVWDCRQRDGSPT